MKKIVILLVVLAVSATGLFADDSTPWVISSIEVVQNDPVRTNSNAILGYIDLEEGQVFATGEEFAEAMENELQDLKNTRYFAEISFETAEGTADSDGNIPVSLTITTSDAWTFLPIPYPLPDSQIGSNGWAFGLEINYDNFFGTMTDFYMDSNVKMAFGEDEKLRAWKVNPELRNVKMGSLMFDFKLKQVYEINQSFDSGGGILQRYSYYTSLFAVATDIEFGTDWTYGFEPSFLFNYGYDWSSGDRQVYISNVYEQDGIYYNREDPFSFKFDHFIQQGAIDWDTTFRKGYELQFSNESQFNISRAAEQATANEFLFITDFDLSAAWYVPFAKVLNYYTRAEALFVVGEIRTGLAEDVVRGVKDDSMQGNMAFFWQNTLVIQPHRSNTKFNFQFHPFVDVGIAMNYNNPGAAQDPLLRVGVGTELVAMIGGIDLRARVGVEPATIGDTGFVDFSFGTGLTY